jgi:hypothetical protein
VDLLKALKVLVDRQPYGRVAHGYRVIQRYGHRIRSAVEIGAFLTWMEAEGLSASTRRSIVGLLRRVQPHNVALQAVQIKVPARSVQHEVLSKAEIQKVLKDLQEHENWFYVCFALWLNTGLRNSELIGLTWDAVHLQEGELVISKTLRRNGAPDRAFADVTRASQRSNAGTQPGCGTRSGVRDAQKLRELIRWSAGEGVETISEASGCGAQTVVFGAPLILESCAGVGEFSCRSGIDGGSSDGGTAQDLCETNRSVEVTVLGMRIRWWC